MRNFLFFFFTVFTLSLFSSGVKDGFQCLKIYDYFKAKQIFTSKVNSDPVPASFGLSIIYSRNDNPFTNYDSAYKFIRICQLKFVLIDSVKKIFLDKNYSINSSSIDSVLNHITKKGFESYYNQINKRNIEKLNDFLNVWHDHSQIQQLINLRDSLALYSGNFSMISLKEWLKTFPQSNYYEDAFQLYQNAIYKEKCAGQTVLQYNQFIHDYPENPNVILAQEEILKKEIAARNTAGLLAFINSYPQYKKIKEVWKEFFILSVDSYTSESLQGFLNSHPTCPLKEEILEELTLMNLELWPVYKNGLFGYADTSGNLRIPLIYSGAENFQEGWAQVSDSVHVGFINKNGKITIPLMYDETGNFSLGVTRVLLNGSFYLINRNNEKIAGPFQELGDFNYDRAVCKRNEKWGAINHEGKEIIEFKFDHLGDFSEGLAPASMYGRYGYIETNGFWVIENVYEWAGEFKHSQAKIKLKGKFGIIDQKGQRVIPPDYDLITELLFQHYLVVQNNYYGVFHQSGCIAREVKYIYNSAINEKEIIGKNHIRLIYKSSENISDYNGNLLFNVGEMETVSLPKGAYSIVKKSKTNHLINIKSMQTVYSKFTQGFLLDNGLGFFTKNNKTSVLKNQKLEEFNNTVQGLEVLSPALIKLDATEGILLLKPDLSLFNSQFFDRVEIWQNNFVVCEKDNQIIYYRISDGKSIFQ